MTYYYFETLLLFPETLDRIQARPLNFYRTGCFQTMSQIVFALKVEGSMQSELLKIDD